MRRVLITSTLLILLGILPASLHEFAVIFGKGAVFADELPLDPDFVKTWDDPLPDPPVTSAPVAPTTTPSPRSTPRTTVNTVPTVTEADRQALLKANLQQQQLLENLRDSQAQQEEINSLAENSLQKYQVLREVNSTLQQELDVLDQQQRQMRTNIDQISLQLDKLTGQLDITSNRLLLKEQEIDKQKMALVSYVQAIYDTDNASLLEVLLSSRTFADSLDEIDHMRSLESAGQGLLERLRLAADELKGERESLEQKKLNIARLHTQLVREERALEQQQTSRRFLLEKTQGKEVEYQAMLEEFRAQAALVEEDILALNTEIAEIKAPLSLEAIGTRFGDRYALTNPKSGAIWPVDAAYKGISAYFRDSGYQKLFGFPHSAIDIPAPSETPIRSPANAVVLKVVDNDGGSYNYLVLYHGTDADGEDITTVYGHLPKIFVAKGDIVRRGDIVAVTGGAPGTRGTGPYYTGPHLHFEVRQNGVAIDPLSWLP